MTAMAETTSPLSAPAWWRAMPWCDAAGRFSWLKLTVLVLLFVPAALIGADFIAGSLGPRPLNEAIHQIGNWALKLILISLAVTPARTLLRWPRVVQLRRMIGVAAFAYVAAHLVLYMADEAWDLGKVATEIAVRIYLTIGFVALLILAALAATSTDAMTKRLGGRRWRNLHRTVYLAALLSVIHFFMQTKANVNEPWVMAGLFAWLMAWRAANWSGRAGRLWVSPLLAMVATAVTALGEAVYYAIKVNAPFMRILEANLMFSAGLRPAVVVLLICAGVAAIGYARTFTARKRKGAYAAASSRTIAAPFSPIMIDGALVLPVVRIGMIEASMTRSPCTPRTRRRGSVTAMGSSPILQVPTG
jgi:sulfoxide reductase heme-binding subunit YedZ